MSQKGKCKKKIVFLITLMAVILLFYLYMNPISHIINLKRALYFYS